MRTAQEISYFIGFCKIIEDKFSEGILKKFSNSSQRQLSLFKDSLKASLKTNKSCLLVDTDGDTLLMGDQINIALNIIEWLEEQC